MNSAECDDEFLARMQHALRTPLTATLGMGDLALSNWSSWSDADRRELVADGIAAAHQLLQLIAILDDPIARGCSAIDLKIVRVDLAGLCHEAVASVRATYDQPSPIEFDGSEGAFVHGDAQLLGQAIAALFDNGLAFGAADQPVSVAWHCDAQGATITIGDRGAGIPPQLIARVFDPYVCGGTTGRRSYNGLGLGLTIARRIARLHGGDVEIASDSSGTTARLHLPTAPPEQGSSAALSSD